MKPDMTKTPWDCNPQMPYWREHRETVSENSGKKMGQAYEEFYQKHPCKRFNAEYADGVLTFKWEDSIPKLWNNLFVSMTVMAAQRYHRLKALSDRHEHLREMALPLIHEYCDNPTMERYATVTAMAVEARTIKSAMHKEIYVNTEELEEC